jgi:hypothetical protein
MSRTDFGQWFSAQQQQQSGAAAGSSKAADTVGISMWAPPPAATSGLFDSISSRLGATAAPADYTFGLSLAQRWQAFGLLMCGSLTLYAMSLFVFLPLILFAPAKFASAFTFASLMWLLAMACVRGPRTMAATLFSNGNLLVTMAYLASIALTLYATMVVQSYLLTMVAVAVQLGAAAWYSASFIPGGTAAMSALSGMLFARPSMASLLPMVGGR